MVVKEAVQQAVQLLQGAGVSDANTDAFLLLEAAAGIAKTDYLLHPEHALSPEDEALFGQMISRRASHEPCQYIIGKADFYGLSFAVDARVLIPRQDTEVLVEQAIQVLRQSAAEHPAVLDVCTGSGAIAVAIKHNLPWIDVTALDISSDALEVAKENAANNGCEIDFLQSDLFANVKAAARHDLIVSNPPYISESEYHTLMTEVKDYEPALALLAGDKGLDIYERLCKEAPHYLKDEASLLVEIGCTQAEAVSEIFSRNGFTNIQVQKDLAGLDRVVIGRRQAER